MLSRKYIRSMFERVQADYEGFEAVKLSADDLDDISAILDVQYGIKRIPCPLDHVRQADIETAIIDFIQN